MICFIAISLYIYVESREFPDGGGTFPGFAAGSAIILCFVLLAASFPEWINSIRDYLKHSGGAVGNWLASMLRRQETGEDTRIVFDISFAKMKPLWLAALTVIYVLAMFELGYFAASILFLFIAVWMVGVQNLRAIALTAVILFPIMYGFFIVFLHANLPRGILF